MQIKRFWYNPEGLVFRTKNNYSVLQTFFVDKYIDKIIKPLIV